MKTVHLIMNAHLDPVWLWPWQAGLDSALNTCRSVCDRLDAHPDVIFTRGEAWVYDQIERCEPKLFERIRKHVKSGQWEIVGGWWIQPDCNQPSGFAMEKQIEVGKQYFLDRFGTFPKIAYNVDSFGHAATLPTIMRKLGQDRYVMMRPQEHELKLPARLFRWREKEGSPEVVTFRIPNGYNWWPTKPDLKHFEKAVTELPDGIDHTMCFVGVGDHGGGPTEHLIQYIRENMTAIPGIKLEFSSPRRFFDAVAKQVDALPVVTGELQYHAVGCYSVYRPVKVGVRKAEHLMAQAEVALAKDPNPPKNAAEKSLEAWKHICFHHFHDTLGGSCLPSAYPQVLAQLGSAQAFADEVIQYSLRRQLTPLSDDPKQRLAFFNASDAPFDDFAIVEPWMEWVKWDPAWKLIDEKGNDVPFQHMDQEALQENMTRLVIRLKAAPGELRVLRVDTSGKSPLTKKTLEGPSLVGDEQLKFAGKSLPRPRFDLIDDKTDTWSHGVDRYPEETIAKAEWDAPIAVDTGPLMASVIQHGKIGTSKLRAEYRVYESQPFVELLLRVHWTEIRRLLKLTFALPSPGKKRIDGVLGGETPRPLDGQESTIRDFTWIELDNGSRLGIVCPDVYAVDVNKDRLRLTLLRGTLMAHHDPTPPTNPRGEAADQGVHDFRFRFFFDSKIDAKELDRQAFMLNRPLAFADLTRGMPLEWKYVYENKLPK